MADNLPKHGSFCWNELVTRDIGTAKKFYTDLLGWTVREMPMRNGVYTVFKAGDKDIGGMYAVSPEMGGVPSHWMGYIAVEDVDALAKKAGELGGMVIVPPTDVPEVGRMAVITDPTGAAVALMTFM
ncbi:MAG: VOC family protein [Candidatus Zixiibacteriota bacterium]